MSAAAAETPTDSNIDAAALAFARRFGLVQQDGSIKCAKPLCERDGKLPSLCCEVCQDRRRRGLR